MSLLKKLAGQTAIYGLSSILGRMLNYFLVPLYTTQGVLAVSEFGVVTDLYAYVAFLNILYTYGLETTYFRFSKKADDKYYHIAVTSIVMSSIIISGLLLVFASNISTALGYEGKGLFIQWLGLILAIDAIVAIPFARLRKEDKATKFATFKLVNISVNILLNLFFLAYCPSLAESNPESPILALYNSELGVGYVFLSNFIANGLLIVFFIPTWLKTKISFDGAEWKRMLNYAWPIMVIGFAGVTNEMLSRVMLKYRLPEGFYGAMTNLEALGVFGACYKLSIFMSLAVQAFRYAFEPFFFAKASDKNSPVLFGNVMTWFVIFTSFSWLLISISLPYIAPVFLRQNVYLEALDTVPLLLGGGLLLGVFYNLSIWYKLTDNTRYGAIISVIGALLTIMLNWFLIPEMGYMGSAWVTFFAYLSMVLISYFWGKRIYPVPYNLPKVIGYFVLASLGIIINNWAQSMLSSFLIVLFFLFLLFILERRTLLKKV